MECLVRDKGMSIAGCGRPACSVLSEEQDSAFAGLVKPYSPVSLLTLPPLYCRDASHYEFRGTQMKC